MTEEQARQVIETHLSTIRALKEQCEQIAEKAGIAFDLGEELGLDSDSGDWYSSDCGDDY